MLTVFLDFSNYVNACGSDIREADGMETLGDRIRRMRLARGLSQQQLAGDEMTRSFICRIERGKVRPSRQTLELFAARLGRPVEYFTGETEGDQLQARERTLLLRAGKALGAGRPDSALELARSALSAALTLGSPEAECRARLQLIKIHEQRGEYRAALAVGEPLDDQTGATSPPILLADVCLRLGNCAAQAEQLQAAVRYYRKALRLAGSRRRLDGVAMHAWLALGCCSQQMGDLDEAAAAYRSLERQAGGREWTGLARLGLGEVMFTRGDGSAALELTREARSALEALRHPAAVYARHNQAVMEGRAGRWDRSIDLLQDCLQTYAQRGETRPRAGALEEIAQCFLVHGYLPEALQVCSQALSLLDGRAESLLRGRLYRQIATIHLAGGDAQRAHDLGLVSLELFRHLGARVEADATLAFLTELRTR